MKGTTADGSLLFARYAFPPNELGYCGPPDAAPLLEAAAASRPLAAAEATARCFEGTWPYLEFIAARKGIEDPLDPRVVEAYWLGGDLIADLDVAAGGAELLDALRRTGGSWARSTTSLPSGMTPDHNFHVFAVYPWLGLLNRNLSDQPRLVLDRCRIRWGEVMAVSGEIATVRSRSITWDGSRLGLGGQTEETARLSRNGAALVSPVSPGDVVALHWDWVCDRLCPAQHAAIRESTSRHLTIANLRLERGLDISR
jgi:hypothetical protein